MPSSLQGIEGRPVARPGDAAIAAMAHERHGAAPPISILLVHGGFVDGSGWEGVFAVLKDRGFDVTIVQNPTSSLSEDVAVTRRAIDNARWDVVLVGHSYGGAVISEAGTAPKVVGLVYVAAFAPDEGESVASLIAAPAPGTAVPPILPPRDGFLLLDREKFAASFAADLPKDRAEFMAASQIPWGVAALEGVVSEPAWRWKPSWYLVASEDKMIPPDAQRSMAKRAHSQVMEVAGSHAVYVAKPVEVAGLIDDAARKVAARATSTL